MGFGGLGNMALDAANARSGFLTDLMKFKEAMRMQRLQMLQNQAAQIRQERAQRAAAKKAQQEQTTRQIIAAAATVATGGLGAIAAPAIMGAGTSSSPGTTNLMSLQNMLDNDFKVGIGR